MYGKNLNNIRVENVPEDAMGSSTQNSAIFSVSTYIQWVTI